MRGCDVLDLVWQAHRFPRAERRKRLASEDERIWNARVSSKANRRWSQKSIERLPLSATPIYTPQDRRIVGATLRRAKKVELRQSQFSTHGIEESEGRCLRLASPQNPTTRHLGNIRGHHNLMKPARKLQQSPATVAINASALLVELAALHVASHFGGLNSRERCNPPAL